LQALPASGAHELIINGPQPVPSLAQLPLEQVLVAVETWRERMHVHAPSACVQLIVNERRAAGASLPHTHAQLYALDFVAPRGAAHSCWRIEVLPRLTHLAGLELSTDINLNIVAPEQAAALLREA